MMRRLALPFFSLIFLCLSTFLAHAQGTRLWSQSTFDEFEKGTPQGVAVRSDGLLTSGPQARAVLTTPSTYIWSLAADRAGNAYLATGSPATVLRVTPDGKSTTLFTTKDLSVQVVRVGPDGSIYAATLPSGKVYKFSASAKDLNENNATVVFDPAATKEKPKYIWDMAFDKQGRLYIATGAPAAIYRVNPAKPKAAPDMFFKSDEEHIRCLAFDAEDNLIAGSDGTGLVYRIDKSGKGYVIYDAPKREITALALGRNGTIYASGVGEKGQSSLPPLPVQGGSSTITATIKIVQPGSVKASSENTVIPEGSEVYEISPQGAPRKLWASQDIVYALHSTPEGLLAATGNRGRIYRITEDGEYADVAHLEAGQAAAFADTAKGLYIATSNVGKLYMLGHTSAAEGTYLSEVHDAGVFSQWGRIEADNGPGRSAANYDLYARTGNIDNPKRGWTDWKKITPNGGNPGLDAARFVQWKAVLRPGASVASVGVNYLPVNVAPAVDEIVVVTGVRVNTAAVQTQQPKNTTISFPSTQNGTVNFTQNPDKEPLAAIEDKGSITVRWMAHDDNGDKLTYTIYYRGEGETNWQLLKDRVTKTYYTFNAELLPDGPYRIKIVASDAPSHNPGEALTGERVSNRFLIDTTPPTLTPITAQLAGGKIHATFTATDSSTTIAHAEYSVDAGPWQYIEPVGKLSDSLVEHYDFNAPLNARPPNLPAPIDPSEHVITVRVYDRFGNVTAGKAVVR